jgi:hypothetical protein
VLAFLGSFACSSSDGGPPNNVAPDGSYGFDGTGWTYDDNGIEPRWNKGDLRLFVVPSTEARPDVAAWAQTEYASVVTPPPPLTPEVSLFTPTPLPGTSAYWYGFHSNEASVESYESFWSQGAEAYRVEINGATLSRGDAEATLATFRILK